MIETVFKLTCMALLFCGARCFSLSKVFIRGTRLTMKASSHNTAANTVIVLSGATSVGKSAVAMELCRILDGEIVSADSVQVYKRLDIAANKPTAEEQQSIRHHVIDVTDPSNQLSTGDFSRLASQAVRDIISRGKVPVVVGGSTMWMQWLVHGVPDAPKATEEVVTQVEDLIGNLESARDWEKGLEVLRGHDPQRAEQIERNDWYRLRRSLEIALSLSKGNNSSHDSGDENSPNKLTGLRKPVLDEFDLRTFFLTEDREELFHTIDRRCVKMLQNGMMNEIVSLIVEGHLKPEFPVSRSIGYRQGIEYLVSERTSEGKLEYFEEFLRNFATASRNYAARQIKWHKKDEKFIFLKIHRSKSRSADSSILSDVDDYQPYFDVVDEVIHLSSVNSNDFKDRLSVQLQHSSIWTELKTLKKIPNDFDVSDPAKRFVLAAMLHLGEIKIAPHQKDFSWVRIIHDKQYGVTPEEFSNIKYGWSYEEPDIRASEGIPGKGPNSKMKAYQSRLFGSANANRSKERNLMKTSNDNAYRYQSLLEECERCRTILQQTQHSEVVEAFRSDWDLSR